MISFPITTINEIQSICFSTCHNFRAPVPCDQIARKRQQCQGDVQPARSKQEKCAEDYFNKHEQSMPPVETVDRKMSVNEWQRVIDRRNSEHHGKSTKSRLLRRALDVDAGRSFRHVTILLHSSNVKLEGSIKLFSAAASSRIDRWTGGARMPASFYRPRRGCAGRGSPAGARRP
jgi:hypothetical protein